jgi:hypothetical protein
MFVVFLVCFVCEHAVKFNKSNTTPRSRVITLNVVFNISARPTKHRHKEIQS